MAKITIVGLGTAKIDDLSCNAYKKVFSDEKKYMRTRQHPVNCFFKDNNIKVNYFDSIYEEENDFDSVFTGIIRELEKDLLNGTDVTYFVPGSPYVNDFIVEHFVENKKFEVEIFDGQSFIDKALKLCDFDNEKEIKIINAANFHENKIDINCNTVIMHLERKELASKVKIALLEKYPADYNIKIIDVFSCKSDTFPIFLLDRLKKYAFSAFIFIESVEKSNLQLYNINNLIEIMEILRGSEGCPWDISQTHESLRECILEEAYEVIDAVQNNDVDNLVEELGDILLQIIFHSQIGKEEGTFDFQDVTTQIVKKMILRHPHVFNNENVENEEQVIKNWEEIKNREKSLEKFTDKFDYIPKSMSSLDKAYKIQKIAAEIGFDWPDINGSIKKIKEETDELLEALKNNDSKSVEEELGDLLFAITNFARFKKINPAIALNITNEKFVRRLKFVESSSKKELHEMTLEEMDFLWEKSKKH